MGKGKRLEQARSICNNPLSGDLVAIVGDSLVGSALTAIVVCVSQAPANAQQSRHALEFGETFSQLTLDHLEARPAAPLHTLREAAEACLATNRENLNTISTNRYTIRRAAMARDALSRLAVLEHFSQL